MSKRYATISQLYKLNHGAPFSGKLRKSFQGAFHKIHPFSPTYFVVHKIQYVGCFRRNGIGHANKKQMDLSKQAKTDAPLQDSEKFQEAMKAARSFAPLWLLVGRILTSERSPLRFLKGEEGMMREGVTICTGI